MPPFPEPTEYFELDGVGFYGWVDVLNLEVLWQYAPKRGGNTLIPGADGRRAHARRLEETEETLQLVIVGTAETDGDPAGDVRVTLLRNVRYLQALEAIPDNVDSTRTGRLYLPDGESVSGPVQVGRATFAGAGAGALKATLPITIPAGMLELDVGSGS